MGKHLASIGFLLLAFPIAAQAAPDLSGTWQGKGAAPYVLKIGKTPSGGFRADLYSLEERGFTLNGNPISAVSVSGDRVTFTVDRSLKSFEGQVSPDGKSISGMWSRGQEATTFDRATKQTEWTLDPSPHTARFVTVEKNVKLEVLDWGGNGPPLVFLTGAGNSAHVFDQFAPKFTSAHHVYAITRRGFGVSSWPAPTAENYDPDRLGDDVVAVIDALKLDKPILAGHSIGGEELSSVATRHPEKISGLIYLDAAWAYAYYDPNGEQSLYVYAAAIERDAKQLIGASGDEARGLIANIEAMIPKLQQSLEPQGELAKVLPNRTTQRSELAAINQAMVAGARKYGSVKTPALAIFARPHACQPNCDTPLMKMFEVQFAAQVDAFEVGNPSARVVRLPYADHYVYKSNEAEVEREMNDFMKQVLRP